MGIRGNLAAGSAAKNALDGDISDVLIPFSDFKCRVNKHVLELWQSDSEWDEFLENKLHTIFSNLKLCTICARTDRRQVIVICGFHIGHSYVTHSFLLKSEEPPMCIVCDELLTVELTLLFCSDLIEIRERFYSSVTADFISGHIIG